MYAVQENPFFVMLLAEVSLIGGNTSGPPPGPLLGGHARRTSSAFASSTLRYLARLGFCPFLLTVFMFLQIPITADQMHKTHVQHQSFRLKGSVRRG